jgi:hypothetical protein
MSRSKQEEKMTKTELLKRCKTLINQGGIFEPGSDAYAFLFDLLQRHPRAAQKIGPGVAAFKVGHRCIGRITRCFYVVHVCGPDDYVRY